MKNLHSITVMGGSAASGFSDDKAKSWPYLLKASLPSEIDFRVETSSGLTFVRAISSLADFSNKDLLVFHFGTSIGWPISLVKLGYRLGMDFTTDFVFHQPAYSSATKSKRWKSLVKMRIRNIIKYVLYLSGAYKPRASHREIDDQIEAVVRVAQHQSKRIMWIQHQSLQNRRIFLERRSYKRYYTGIEQSLQKYKTQDFVVVTLPESFLKSENYLLDCVHLSEKGHQEMCKLVQEAFKSG